jgi:5,10-methylenetetrahydromethanopterin reductase
MKIGLALFPDRPARKLAELAAAAEDAGFAELWWPDHYNSRELATVLTLSAVSTSRIRIGTAVTSVLLRHPAVLASMFATLAELSDGRIVAGLGPGGWEVGADLNVTTPSPLGVTKEAASILRQLLEGQQVDASGNRFFPVHRAALRFKSPGEPVPIYLAGRGPRMLELAGEVADGVITHGLAPSYLDLVRERRTEGALRSGRSPDSCEIVIWTDVAVGKREEAMAALRPRSLQMVGGSYDAGMIPAYGLVPSEVMAVRSAVRAHDSTAASLITDQMVQAFNLGGPLDWIGARLLEIGELGVDSVILSMGEGVEASEIVRLGRGIREVMT